MTGSFSGTGVFVPAFDDGGNTGPVVRPGVLSGGGHPASRKIVANASDARIITRGKRRGFVWDIGERRIIRDPF
jgi:hypothetical protein